MLKPAMPIVDITTRVRTPGENVMRRTYVGLNKFLDTFSMLFLLISFSKTQRPQVDHWSNWDWPALQQYSKTCTRIKMLDGLPLELVARIGELGRWNERTFFGSRRYIVIRCRACVPSLKDSISRAQIEGMLMSYRSQSLRANGLLTGESATRKWHGA